MGKRRWGIGRDGWLVGLVAAAAIGWGTGFREPPRFDGAGYAVLGWSLATGQGYRALDHPDRPRHAHFPPGYPIALAALWAVTGRSVVAAHLFSWACTTAAVVLAWRWFRALYPRRIALALGLALAINWTWVRFGGEIRSEPLYLLLGQLAVWLAWWGARRGLGVVLGAATLTRHVGIALALAIGIDLGLRGRRRSAATMGLVVAAILAPWAFWMARVGQGTQVGLVPGEGLPRVLAENAWFYTRRLPDQVTGPLVEVATVFRPGWARPAGAWAVAASALIVAGWVAAARSKRRRLAALVPATTLPLLLAWPFTEAGRFLVPLVPFVLVGALEGLGCLLRLVNSLMSPFMASPDPMKTGGTPCQGVVPGPGHALAGRATHSLHSTQERLAIHFQSKRRHPRGLAAALVLAASVPYSVYALVADRPGAARRAMIPFDAACAWIARQADRPGPVLSRHPGEVDWLSGRPGLAAPDDDQAIEDLIQKYHVDFLLIDDSRFARAPASPLGRFAARHPDRVARAWDEGGVAVFVVRPRGGSRVDDPGPRGDAPASRGRAGTDAP